MPGWSPSFVKFAPYFASRFATRMSQTSARPSPPPIAWPFSAPITGTSISSSDRNGLYIAKLRSFGSTLRPSPPPRWICDLKSAPAQKLLPRPVTTRQRSSASCLARDTAARSPSSTSSVMEFRFSGRFRVRVAM